MSRIITTERGEVKALAKMFECTPRTINNYLNGRTPQGPDYNKVRKVALERGAIELKNHNQ